MAMEIMVIFFSGPMTTITTLLLTLVEISQKGPLPRKMLLQMDNCVRENKNKFVMAFLALLVEKRVFVEVSYVKLSAEEAY